jgi:hypothetical protein
MSATTRRAWTAVVQDADGNQETELVTIVQASIDEPPLIELTDGTRITCVEPAGESIKSREAA